MSLEQFEDVAAERRGKSRECVSMDDRMSQSGIPLDRRTTEAKDSRRPESENAVKTQIGRAVSTSVLTATFKKEFRLNVPLYTLLREFSVSVFERTEAQRAFAKEGCRITSMCIKGVSFD